MGFSDVMRTLERMGTAQNRKVYARHGFGETMYGVSFANLGRLKKAIRTDHALARKLWATGNEDARMLAAMIADPGAMSDKDLESWVRDIRHYVLADVFARHVASASPYAQTKMEQWTKSRDEWIGRTGWMLLSILALREDGPQDRYLEAFLPKIVNGIHRAENKTRDAMNAALISIGLRGGALTSRAIAAARRIGYVEVDHGETSCKTPDAAEYIQRALAANRGRAVKRANARKRASRSTTQKVKKAKKVKKAAAKTKSSAPKKKKAKPAAPKKKAAAKRSAAKKKTAKKKRSAPKKKKAAAKRGAAKKKTAKKARRSSTGAKRSTARSRSGAGRGRR